METGSRTKKRIGVKGASRTDLANKVLGSGKKDESRSSSMMIGSAMNGKNIATILKRNENEIKAKLKPN